MSDIPIVGQRGKVVMWWPSTLINCTCRPDRVSLVVVTGFLNYSACGHCGTLYAATGFSEEKGPSGLPVIEVSITLPTAKKEIM